MTLKECYATLCGNYDEALSRLMNERLMERFLQKFLSDPSFNEIKDAIENKDGTVRLCDINPNNSLLTVNAIDGTMIDRNYGY